MSIIIPAILTANIDDFTGKLAEINTFPSVTNVQIDFADGRFAPHVILMPSKIPTLPLKYVFAAHLMVIRPADYIVDIQRAGFEQVALHLESFSGIQEFKTVASLAKDSGLDVQLAFNPDTSIDKVTQYIKEGDVGTALVLGVHPGFQGSPYIPETENRVLALRQADFYGTIIVDGGVSKDNIRNLITAGADNLVVGSAIFHAKHPKEVYIELLKESGENLT